MAKPPKQPRSLSPIGNYDVGYCKPPKAHQFKEGQPSANPKGRPKGSPKGSKANPLPFVDIPIYRMVLEEAMRLVQVREGTKVVKITAIEAGMRATLLNAARGSNPAMRNVHMMTAHAHVQARAELEERIKAALEYKRAATAHALYCKRKGLRFDWDFHPDDVHIDYDTGEVYLNGPKNPEEREALRMMFCALDDASGSFNALAQQIRENPRLQKVRKHLGLLIMAVDRINGWLPAHYQEAVDPEIRALAIMPDETSDE